MKHLPLRHKLSGHIPGFLFKDKHKLLPDILPHILRVVSERGRVRSVPYCPCIGLSKIIPLLNKLALIISKRASYFSGIYSGKTFSLLLGRRCDNAITIFDFPGIRRDEPAHQSINICHRFTEFPTYSNSRHTMPQKTPLWYLLPKNPTPPKAAFESFSRCVGSPAGAGSHLYPEKDSPFSHQTV